MRVQSCTGACLIIVASCASAFAQAAGTATSRAVPDTAKIHVQSIGNVSACRRACKSKYVCVGAYGNLKQACLDDRKACMAACK